MNSVVDDLIAAVEVLFDRDRRDNALMRPLRLLMRYVPVPWVFVLAYLCGVGLEYALPIRPAVVQFYAVDVAGGALMLAGITLAGWGWLTFRRARTTTVPGQASARLVTWGPYRYSRNPMYVGLSVMYVGEAGLLHQIWPVLLLLLVIAYLDRIVIPLEERKLREVFEEEYERYRSQVRRWV